MYVYVSCTVSCIVVSLCTMLKRLTVYNCARVGASFEIVYAKLKNFKQI